MEAVGKCDVGKERLQNEDAIYVSDGSGSLEHLYIVADGIGGHAGGAQASSMAIDCFLEYLERHIPEDGELLDTFIGALQYANSCIYNRSRLERSLSGMGTTFLAVAVEGNTLYAVHIGDSRLYLYRDDMLTQLTRDHSYVMDMVRQGKLTGEEARSHPKRNIITKALGIDQTAMPDTIVETIQPKDQLLLCSDGLYSMVTDEEIAFVLGSLEFPAALAVERLVALANEYGGKDNISVIIYRDGR